MRKQKYFGTDGIRGRVGESLLNPEFVLRLGWAAGKVLGAGNGGKVLVGKDTRISGYLLESLLEAGLTSAGIDTLLLGPMPTPAIAYLTRTLRASAGIVISASHNPYYDNGIKFFSPEGVKLNDEMELAIEEYLDCSMRMVDASKLGKAKRINDSPGRYIEFCKSTLGLNARLKGLKIVVDCANGATYQIAPAVFRELGAEVIELGGDPDGFNINDNCGSTHPNVLAKIVPLEEADLGIAFDGDGDRVVMVDHKGEIVDGDELVYIIAKHNFDEGRLQGGVVGTLMSNFGLERRLNELGIGFVRSKVGDRYVIEALRENNWLIGGESSGHIVHLGITTTGDGIVSALQVLRAMTNTNRSLHDLKNEMQKFPQTLINVKCFKPIDIHAEPAIQHALQIASDKLKDDGRVLLRSSGTEPVIRVMVEGIDQKLVKNIANDLAIAVKGCLEIF
ncbi:MAG: phosphoglucosamine mutase [Gammaproteobacteria bacterium]|nr:phosphoglucosamine mutase [Gammaproteobacteria bacterium]